MSRTEPDSAFSTRTLPYEVLATSEPATRPTMMSPCAPETVSEPVTTLTVVCPLAERIVASPAISRIRTDPALALSSAGPATRPATMDPADAFTVRRSAAPTRALPAERVTSTAPRAPSVSSAPNAILPLRDEPVGSSIVTATAPLGPITRFFRLRSLPTVRMPLAKSTIVSCAMWASADLPGLAGSTVTTTSSRSLATTWTEPATWSRTVVIGAGAGNVGMTAPVRGMGDEERRRWGAVSAPSR